MVVDKPSGLPSQPARGGSDSVLGRLEPEARLPHRLDAGASGLLVVMVHPAAHKPLADAFRDRKVRRTYLAVLDGHLAAPATWDRPVHRKPARSQAEPLGHGPGCSAVQLTLDTGRKHQLRVHAALAGHPILGDRRYGDEAAGRWPRLALHAWRLRLDHPVTGEPLALKAAVPDDLAPLVRDAGVELP